MIDPASPVHRPAASERFFAEGHHIAERWNSTADTDVSVARARVEPGVTTRRHRLPNTAERYLILEGRGRVEVGDGPPEDVGPGDVVLVPPGFLPENSTVQCDSSPLSPFEEPPCLSAR